MKFFLKLAVIFIICALFFILTYLLFGERLEFLFSQEKCMDWFFRIKPFAWLIGIFLLISDILFPVPATGIIAALGCVYGVWQGALISSVGMVLAGLTGYGIANMSNRKVSRWIASEKELKQFKIFFDHWGGYAVIISRIMPVMPETISILAGLSEMKFSRFLAALCAGAVPVSFFFAWMGGSSDLTPGAGILVAVLLPVLVWPLFLKVVKI